MRLIKIYRKILGKFSNLHAIITAVALIMLWRGVWGLMDNYLFPENPDLSFVFSILAGLLILFLDDFRFEEIRGSGSNNSTPHN